MAIRTLLVDDVEDVRRLVCTALRLRGGFEVVGEADSGAQAVALADSLRPDVVVLDLGLPDIAGQEVFSSIRATSPDAKVVIFSGSEADRDSIGGQADGFVLKDAAVDYLVDLMQSFGQHEHTESVLDLPQDPTSAAEARRFVAEKVADWELTDLLDDALLVASELATNAVTHAESSCRIRLSLKPAALRIDVIDAGSGTPEPLPSSPSAEHGRGLYLVDALASAWGLETTSEDGKVVWAELARS